MYGSAKITPAVVERVLAMLREGMSQWDVALEMGISQASVSNIRNERITVEGLLRKDQLRAAASRSVRTAVTAEDKLAARLVKAQKSGLRGEDGMTPDERMTLLRAKDKKSA